MDWPEIKRRLTKENTSVQILADLEGVPYKTMYQRIKWHERQDGKKYIQPHQEHPEPKKPTKKEQREAAVKLMPETFRVAKENEKALKEVAAFMEQHPDGIKVEIRPEVVPEIPEDVYTNERKLMPETIEEILTMYKQCCELADRYTKQAEDWARIMKLLQLEESERIRRT